MIKSSFKIALSLCLLSLFCLLFLGDLQHLAYAQLLGVPIIILIFLLSAISIMFGLIAIGSINGFWSSIGRGFVILLSFGVALFSGFIWFFDHIT